MIDNIILGAGVVLIAIILIVLVRVQSLISMVRRSPDQRVGSSNRINAAMWLVVMIAGAIAATWSAISAAEHFLPEASSEHGKEIDTLFWVTNGITGAVFIATNILLFYFPYKYQYKEGRKAHYYPDNNRLEVAWTVVPAIVLTLLVLSGWKVWRDITSKAPENAEVVEIMGYQFAWESRYPGKDSKLGAYNFKLTDATNQMGLDFSDENTLDDFQAGSEIHIPKGRPVVFKIRARDVLHSVFAPHFRLKMDAVPGMPTSFWFVPTKSTNDMKAETGNPNFTYEIACTEVCGKGHFSMRARIVVDEEEDYQAWLSKQKPFLATNPDYMSKVPKNLQEKAMRIIGNASPDANPSAKANPKPSTPAIQTANPSTK